MRQQRFIDGERVGEGQRGASQEGVEEQEGQGDSDDRFEFVKKFCIAPLTKAKQSDEYISAVCNPCFTDASEANFENPEDGEKQQQDRDDIIAKLRCEGEDEVAFVSRAAPYDGAARSPSMLEKGEPLDRRVDEVLGFLGAFFMTRSPVHEAAADIARRLDEAGIDYAIAGAGE